MAVSCTKQTRWTVPLLVPSSVAARYVVTVKPSTHWFGTFIFLFRISLCSPALQPCQKGRNAHNCYQLFKSEFDYQAIGDVTCTPYTHARLDAYASMGLSSLCMRDKEYWLTHKKLVFRHIAIPLNLHPFCNLAANSVSCEGRVFPNLLSLFGSWLLESIKGSISLNFVAMTSLLLNWSVAQLSFTSPLKWW